MTPEEVAEEEARAAAYRAKVRRQARARAAALRALSGNRAAARQVEADWEPLVDGLRDLREGALAHGD